MQLAADEYTPHGLTLADTTVIAREIETGTSIDYITVKAGTFYSSNNIVPDMQHPFGVFLPLAVGDPQRGHTCADLRGRPHHRPSARRARSC